MIPQDFSCRLQLTVAVQLVCSWKVAGSIPAGVSLVSSLLKDTGGPEGQTDVQAHLGNILFTR